MTVRVGLIGTGGIVMANHIPGLALCPDTEVVALCDPNPAALERAHSQLPSAQTFTDYRRLLAEAPVDAVVIATPNSEHAPIALAAIQAGKHVLCEKPIAMNLAEAQSMAAAADAAGVRHMTAFTYRFVPSMHYMKHLVDAGAIGQPYHFRANRFQDFGRRSLGWRQLKHMAGSGEHGDMLSHRIDFAHYLIGPIQRVVANTRQFLADREGRDGGREAADVEDWVAFIGDFKSGPTGVFESTKVATGRGAGGRSHDYCEVNGSEGTLIYFLHQPHVLHRGRLGQPGLEEIPVPEEFLKHAGSPRDPHAGDPLSVFRYDQDFEFIDAIRSGRSCAPSFHDGARVQAVIDAVLLSTEEKRWVEVS